MIGEKFIYLYHSLTKKERGEFYHFLHFDRPQNIEQCLLVLQRCHQKWKKGEHYAWTEKDTQSIRSNGLNKQVDTSRLKHIFSYLTKSLKRYITYLQFNLDKSQCQLHLLKYYNQRNLDNAFSKKAKDIKQQLAKDKSRSIDHFKDSMNIYKEIYIHRSKKGRTGEMGLNEWRSNAYKYLTTELQRLQILVNSYRTHNPQFETELDKEISILLEQQHKTEAGKFYHSLEKLLQEKNDQTSDYDSVAKFFKENMELFPLHEARNSLLILINFCIRQINNGFKAYRKDCLDWYYWGLETGILLEDGQISRYTYKNMISLSIKFQDFNEGEKILTSYKGKLPAKEAEQIFDFNQGRLFFHQRRYKEAMRILQATDIANNMDNLDIRRMLLRMYFEEENFDLLDNHLASFNSYLRRNPGLGYHRTHYLNLVKYTGQVIRAKSKERLEKIYRQVENCPKITDKEWLLNQMAIFRLI